MYNSNFTIMKKNYFLKTMFLAVTMFTYGFSSYALTAGDIAVIGVNADATKTLTFVALADIPANTVVSFTDNGWDATTPAWRTGEGTIQWTNTDATPAGTVITLTLEGTYSSTTGSVTTNGSFNLSTSGDQVLAYEGTTSPTTNEDAAWLFAFSTESFAYADNSNSSDYPTALSGASVAMTTSTTETDNAYLTNTTVSGTKEEVLEIITNTDNYTKSNTILTVPTYSFTVSSTSSMTNSKGGNAPEISAQKGEIIVSANVGETVQVYSTLGMLVKTTIVSEGTSTISVPSGQLYIVKVGSTTRKVLVK